MTNIDQKQIIIFLAVILLIFMFSIAARIYINAKSAGPLIRSAVPFERRLENPSRSILVLGDSLAYGTGTTSPEKSVAGLVASRFPDAQVDNQSENGKRSGELVQEIKKIDKHYDLILIVIGGNDAIHPEVDLNRTGKNIQTIYKTASEHADHVVALSSGDLKYTNFFPWPLNLYFSKRSRIIADYATGAAGKYQNVTYVNMYQRNHLVPFSPEFEAADKLHLNDKGAQYWLDGILESTNDLKF